MLRNPKSFGRLQIRGATNPVLFPLNIAHPVDGVKLLGGQVSLNADLCIRLIEDKVSKTVSLMEVIVDLSHP